MFIQGATFIPDSRVGNYTKKAAGEGKIRVRCLDKHKIRGKIRYPPQPTQLPSDQYYSISLLSPPTTSCRSNWMSAYNRAGGTGWVGLEFAHSILGGLSTLSVTDFTAQCFLWLTNLPILFMVKMFLSIPLNNKITVKMSP